MGPAGVPLLRQGKWNACSCRGVNVPPHHPGGPPPRPPARLGHRPGPAPQAASDDGDWPVDRGRPLGLRLLALVGAISFVMLGLSVIAPLLQPSPPSPAPRQGSGRTA